MNDNKIYYFILRLYSFFKLSFYFWIYLLKGFIFYGLIPSTCALFLTVDMMILKDEEESIKELFRKYYRQFEKYRIQSLLFSFLFIILYMTLLFISKHPNNLSVIFIIVLGYMFILTALLYIYSIYFISFRQLNFKQAIAYSFVVAIKNVFVSLSLLILLILVVYAAFWNLVFFAIFCPFLFALAVRFLFGKLKI